MGREARFRLALGRGKCCSSSNTLPKRQEPGEHSEHIPAERPPTWSSTETCNHISLPNTLQFSLFPLKGPQNVTLPGSPAVSHRPLRICSLLLIRLPKPRHKQHFQQDLHRWKAANLCLEHVYILRKILMLDQQQKLLYWKASFIYWLCPLQNASFLSQFVQGYFF